MASSRLTHGLDPSVGSGGDYASGGGGAPVAGKCKMARALGRRSSQSLQELRTVQQRAREAAIRVLFPDGPPDPLELESDDCPTERCLQIVENSLAKLSGD